MTGSFMSRLPLSSDSLLIFQPERSMKGYLWPSCNTVTLLRTLGLCVVCAFLGFACSQILHTPADGRL